MDKICLFLPDPRDGVFTFTDPTTSDILIESVEDGETKVLVKTSDLVHINYYHMKKEQ